MIPRSDIASFLKYSSSLHLVGEEAREMKNFIDNAMELPAASVGKIHESFAVLRALFHPEILAKIPKLRDRISELERHAVAAVKTAAVVQGQQVPVAPKAAAGPKGEHRRKRELEEEGQEPPEKRHKKGGKEWPSEAPQAAASEAYEIPSPPPAEHEIPTPPEEPLMVAEAPRAEFLRSIDAVHTLVPIKRDHALLFEYRGWPCGIWKNQHGGTTIFCKASESDARELSFSKDGKELYYKDVVNQQEARYRLDEHPLSDQARQLLTYFSPVLFEAERLAKEFVRTVVQAAEKPTEKQVPSSASGLPTQVTGAEVYEIPSPPSAEHEIPAPPEEAPMVSEAPRVEFLRSMNALHAHAPTTRDRPFIFKYGEWPCSVWKNQHGGISLFCRASDSDAKELSFSKDGKQLYYRDVVTHQEARYRLDEHPLSDQARKLLTCFSPILCGVEKLAKELVQTATQATEKPAKKAVPAGVVEVPKQAAAEPKKVAAQAGPPSLSLELRSLDERHRQLQGMAASLIDSGIPRDLYQEKDALAGELAKVEEIERSFQRRYNEDFSIFTSWHGRTSLQRIFWQDEECLKALQNPRIVKAILLRRLEGNEANLGEGNTLSSLVLYGLSSNLLSYLASASPNWPKLPKAEVSWEHLHRLGLATARDDESRRLSPAYLQDFNEALSGVTKAVGPMIPLETLRPNPAIERTLREIQGASIPQLYNTIQTLLGERPYEASELIERSGKGFAEMIWECQEGVHNYQALLGLHGGDDSAVLGYGIISHCLDTLHLIGAISGCAILEKSNVHDPKVRIGETEFNRKDFDPLTTLMQRIKEGRMSPEALSLIKSRLSQILFFLIQKFGDEAARDISDSVKRAS